MIRETIEKDITEIARVHIDTWRTTYQGILPDEVLENLSYEKREQSWQKVFDNSAKDSNFILVAEDKLGNIVGFANGGIERSGISGYQGELRAIYILESHQKKGLGVS